MAVADAQAPPRVPTLQLADLHVTYRVYQERRAALKDLVAGRGKAPRFREINAVRGISLTAYEGEVIGVIGGNGAGKSTLLGAIAGLIPPTSGTVLARSQPSLLGVGAALQPSVSGRRNVELGCLALGLSRDDVETKTEEIIEFTELGDHIDLPLRTYSTGMRARLHFAIATAIEPEVLLVDEALSVGDTTFKQRSRARIKQLRDNAGTVMIVSHSLRAIEKMCSRTLWIEGGKLVRDGKTRKVITEYRKVKHDEED